MLRTQVLPKDLRQKDLQRLIIVVSLLFILLISLQSSAQNLNQSVHHDLTIELLPTLKTIKGKDTLTFPKGSPRKISFFLNKNLQVTVTSPRDSLTLLHQGKKSESFNEYGLTQSSQDNRVTLEYSGVIYDPIINDNSQGLISVDGATLFESTYWYPSILNSQKSFDLSIRVPLDWKAITQGQLTGRQNIDNFQISHFREIYPQEDIYLIAGPFKIFESDKLPGKKLEVLLHQADPALAQNFLAVLPDYIQHYSQEIAPYPYDRFSIIENLWETGLGMPSFTLLGPNVIRLPFIFTSSLPHELLHNWWGNSVYVDYDKGNWSEGLTNYMADYWQQEKINADKDYRLSTLIKFADFVTVDPSNDFPLRQFKERHNASTQAVGYSKSMMFFHMLEFYFGPELFRKALQDFYNQNVFKRASFLDIQKSFEKITQSKLDVFFHQWLDRKGAPSIALTDIKITRSDNGFQTFYYLTQKQKLSYDLSIPVILNLENGSEIHQMARLNQKSQKYYLVSNSRPIKIAVDPDFHVFRDLYPQERPVSLSTVFGSPLLHFYFNGNQPEGLKFAQIWSQAIEGHSEMHNVGDTFDVAPSGAIVLIGDSPAFANFMKNQLMDQKFQLSENEMSIQGKSYSMTETSTVLVTRLKNRSNQTVVWIRWSHDNNPTEWAQRLLHYNNSGVLVFKGRPAVLQTNWPVTDSPLQRRL